MKMINVTQKFRARFCSLLVGAALISPASWAAQTLQQASVTEAVNSVSYQTDKSAPQKPASPGTIIHSDNVVRTGIKSRAELQFNDRTVTRMGANSVFTFDAQSQKLSLDQGSMLFSKPKEAGAFEISTPAATCAISGTTGFLEFLPAVQNSQHFSFLFGLIEGHTKIVIGGVTYNLGPGELLVGAADGSVRIVNFDLAGFLKKAGLVKKFKSTLPNQKEIDEALAKFLSLVDRGFIKFPPQGDGPVVPTLEFYNTSGGEHDLDAQIQIFELQKQQPPPSQPPPTDFNNY